MFWRELSHLPRSEEIMSAEGGMGPPFPKTDKALAFAARETWEERHFLLEPRRRTDNLPGSRLIFSAPMALVPLKHALIAGPKPQRLWSLEEVCKEKQ